MCTVCGIFCCEIGYVHNKILLKLHVVRLLVCGAVPASSLLIMAQMFLPFYTIFISLFLPRLVPLSLCVTYRLCYTVSSMPITAVPLCYV
jgi:hypothetical protein